MYGSNAYPNLKVLLDQLDQKKNTMVADSSPIEAETKKQLIAEVVEEFDVNRSRKRMA